ncbi:MAG: insulinase family protein [Planctomycetes bacterium]|nr:insulinase family protein [Planctomycetota bacterium]
MLRRLLTAPSLVLAVALAAGPLARAQEGDALPLEARVEVLELDNGWRFVLLPRSDAPVISFETWVDTGSRHDPPGATGLANLMKNLLFKGSDRVGTVDWPAERQALDELDAAVAAWEALDDAADTAARGDARARLKVARERAAALTRSEEYSRLLEDAGGGDTLNAYASADATRFVVSLPANQLELWCWMEAERFTRPVLREFYAERDAVLEDRLSRIESSPREVLGEELLALSYGDHPYRHPTIGHGRDLPHLTRRAAREFFEAGYGARHLTTAIVGDFDVPHLTTLLERYFAGVPAGPPRAWPTPPAPVQAAERRLEVPWDAPPEVQIAWHAPGFAHDDTPALHLALRLLGSARSSRLERRLLREDSLASEVVVSPGLGGDELCGLVVVRAVPITGVSTEVLEAAIYDEIERLAADGPDPAELAGVQRAARAEHLRSLRDDASLAHGLCEHQAKGGGWRGLFREVERLEAVDADDVRRVVSTYLAPEHRNVVTLVPVAPEEAR